MVDVTSFIQALLFQACMQMSTKVRGEHWEAYSQLGGAKPLAEIVREGARRFDALPEHRCSVEARKSTQRTYCENCLNKVDDPYEHVSNYGPSYSCRRSPQIGQTK